MYLPSSIKQLVFNVTGNGCSSPAAFGQPAAPEIIHNDNFKIDDIRFRCLVHCDIPEIKLMSKINQNWKELSDKSSLWQKIGIALNAPELMNKEQVKKYYQMIHKQAHHCFDDQFLNDNFRTELNVLYNSERIGDINQLREVCKARDTLIIWLRLQDAIGGGNEDLTLANLDSIEALLSKAGEFHGWCEQHQNQLSGVQRLVLNETNLTSLPPQIGNLIGLKSLSLISNQLTSLPTEIVNLAALQRLSLGYNQLITLPEEIGNLVALQWLDLTGNQLASLPKDIEKLASLRTLCLSGNQLTSIPAEVVNLSLKTFQYDASLFVSYQSLKLQWTIKRIIEYCYPTEIDE